MSSQSKLIYDPSNVMFFSKSRKFRADKVAYSQTVDLSHKCKRFFLIINYLVTYDE